MNQYHEFHVELLKQTYNQLLSHYPFTTEELMIEQQDFLDDFVALIDLCQKQSEDATEKGQHFCTGWVRTYSDLTPLLPRDLLWYFGGDCLHYMPDDEIVQFQYLDEIRHEALSAGKEFDYPSERSRVFKLQH